MMNGRESGLALFHRQICQRGKVKARMNCLPGYRSRLPARGLLPGSSMDARQERYAEALRQAAHVLGGEERLAGRLGVDADQLQRWLAREDDVPLSAFLRALGVIADGPYARERRVRVAAIPSEDDVATRS